MVQTPVEQYAVTREQTSLRRWNGLVVFNDEREKQEEEEARIDKPASLQMSLTGLW